MFLDLDRAINSLIEAEQIIEAEKRTTYGDDLDELHEITDRLDELIERLRALDE